MPVLRPVASVSPSPRFFKLSCWIEVSISIWEVASDASRLVLQYSPPDCYTTQDSRRYYLLTQLEMHFLTCFGLLGWFETCLENHKKSSWYSARGAMFTRSRKASPCSCHISTPRQAVLARIRHGDWLATIIFTAFRGSWITPTKLPLL